MMLAGIIAATRRCAVFAAQHAAAKQDKGQGCHQRHDDRGDDHAASRLRRLTSTIPMAPITRKANGAIQR